MQPATPPDRCLTNTTPLMKQIQGSSALRESVYHVNTSTTHPFTDTTSRVLSPNGVSAWVLQYFLSRGSRVLQLPYNRHAALTYPYSPMKVTRIIELPHLPYCVQIVAERRTNTLGSTKSPESQRGLRFLTSAPNTSTNACSTPLTATSV